jgi:hypothetical protein
MKTSTCLTLLTLLLFVQAPILSLAQDNSTKIKGKWIVEKFEPAKDTSQAAKASQDLVGLYLTFDESELIITKKTEDSESQIKRGQYLISGNSLTLGKDQAEIVSISNTNLTISIPRQGILHLKKL